MARPGSNSPRTDKRPRHVVDTYYDMASDDPGLLQVWAYSDRMSYHAGETLALHVNTTGAHYDIEIGRDGLRYETLFRVASLEGTQHATPEDCSITGCGWPVAWNFNIPADWQPGGYLITLIARRGEKAATYTHVIVVRAAKGADREPCPKNPSRPERRPVIPIWNGPGRTVIRRNTPRPAGPATNVT
ncbi:MAG: hypothetical protein HOL02_15440 [Rhodospirillaceae bacterium]|jgi:hypothetical protein|nr:hypothetical protein [Rhodospirillaceae bacterium]